MFASAPLGNGGVDEMTIKAPHTWRRKEAAVAKEFLPLSPQILSTAVSE